MLNNGSTMTEEELLKSASEHLSDACAFLYELDSIEGQIVASMADELLNCICAIRWEEDPRDKNEDAKCARRKKMKDEQESCI